MTGGLDLLSWLRLTKEQLAAATTSEQDVLVTAGAGTGKTRTLVGHYLALLADGLSPRRLLAITFTEKAAREMRNRIRATLSSWAAEQSDPAQFDRWRDLQTELDSARIGTIHSLCAEILRSHPAEAGLDPEFEVLDEAAAAVLKQETVDNALVQAANDPVLAGLYQHFSVWGLRRVVGRLLEQRLDLAAWRAGEAGELPLEAVLTARLAAFSSDPGVVSALAVLRQATADGSLAADSTETMVEMVGSLLEQVDLIQAALAAGNPVGACRHWYQARRQAMRGGVGRRDGAPRLALEALRQAYDRDLQPWIGGASSKDPEVDAALESRFTEMLEGVWAIFAGALRSYQNALTERGQLDFDALEQGALQLMQQQPAIRSRWQADTDHVLVDEFQDTNQRQRELVEAMAGAGRLFVVGDARQSIYRFRGADVSVFRHLGADIAKRGRTFELDTTFRQHRGLLELLDELLAPHMPGGAEFEIPYAGLRPKREEPEQPNPGRYASFVLGVGENAAAGRQVAAELLASHLAELRSQGRLHRWDDAALLFRASSGFAPYERALAEWGIPYLTIAGRGFFERPEIREVLTALRALAEPWNEPAMAGMLRSTLIGMSDVGLFHLRIGTNGSVPFAEAIQSPHASLDEGDEAARLRALRLVQELGPLVDRLPVAQVLKNLIDWTDARAVLAIAGERHWANLDKLLDDARSSRATRVRGFLEYLATLRQAGVREGEAPLAGEGVVQLMTIHKSKGLEWPLVVVADAGYAHSGRSQSVYLHPRLGLVARPDRWSQDSLAYRLAKADDSKREAAEEARLLYVAATRARDQLVVSGHLTQSAAPTLRAPGWVGSLLEAAGLLDDDGQPMERGTGPDVYGFTLAAEAPPRKPVPAETAAWPASRQRPLFAAVASWPSEHTDDDQDQRPAREWRATGRLHPPAVVVGTLVHRALERWLLPPDPALERLLASSALGEGLVEPAQRAGAIELSQTLLARLAGHPVARQIALSPVRRHEIPFTYQTRGGLPESGAFDLLYRHNGGWRLLDFKTDNLHNMEQRQSALERHHQQLLRYQAAAQTLLTEPVETVIVFLDDQGAVSTHTLTDAGWQPLDW